MCIDSNLNTSLEIRAEIYVYDHIPVLKKVTSCTRILDKNELKKIPLINFINLSLLTCCNGDFIGFNLVSSSQFPN